MNGDGKPDLVAACMPVGQDPGKVSVLLNTGTGTFAVQQPPLEVGQNLTAVRLLHLNPGTETGQDSHLDIAVARTTIDADPQTVTSAIVTGLGDGAGGFTYAATKELGETGQAWFLALGDFDEDGKSDLVASVLPGAFTVLRNLGDGTLADDRPVTGVFVPRSVGVGDFTGDGHADVVMTEDFQDVVRVYPGNGNGTFQAPQAVVSVESPIRLIHGDWNNDNHPDLATLDAGSGQVTVLLGNGQGAYTQSASFGASPSLALATADFDEDGNADLVWPNSALERYEIAYGNGDGTFDAPTVFNPAESVSPYLLAAGLFTPGDSHADLAVVGQASTGETVFRLFPGHGNGTFADSKKKVISPTVPALALAAGGDLDGDGRTDFAVALDSGTVQVVRSIEASPGLELGAALSISQGTKPRSVLIADLDNDGDADVATGNSGFYFDGGDLAQDPPPAGWVSRFLNDGTGTFAADSPIPVGDYPTDLAFGDLNGDGYADLALTHLPYFDGDIAPVGVQVLLSNGVGGFLGPEETFTGWAPFSLVITDVNGDGLNDVVDADVATSQVTVLRNYLNVASNERARPKVMFARERPAPRKRVDGLRVASASPLTVTDVVPAAFPLPSTVANNRPYWYHNDHLGTPQVLTDQAGLVVWKGYYQPFGEVTTPVEDVVNNWRFPGQYEDGETGEFYNWNRYYEPETGSYGQFDPLNLRPQSSPNRPNSLARPPYVYAASNPNIVTDRSGLKCDQGCLAKAQAGCDACLKNEVLNAICYPLCAKDCWAGPLSPSCIACMAACVAGNALSWRCPQECADEKSKCCPPDPMPDCTCGLGNQKVDGQPVPKCPKPPDQQPTVCPGNDYSQYGCPWGVN